MSASSWYKFGDFARKTDCIHWHLKSQLLCENGFRSWNGPFNISVVSPAMLKKYCYLQFSNRRVTSYWIFKRIKKKKVSLVLTLFKFKVSLVLNLKFINLVFVCSGKCNVQFSSGKISVTLVCASLHTNTIFARTWCH